MDYILTFLEGIASFISPCLLPMVPIYISYFIGEDDNNNKKALLNSVGFVLGFTTVFLILSIFVSQLGAVLSSNIRYIKIFFGIVIILFGLNYMGLLKIGFLNKSKIKNIDTKNGVYLSFKDMFNDNTYLNRINSYISSLLQTNPEKFDELWKTPTVSENQNFYITSQGIVIFYPPYELSYYSKGFVEIEIPYKEIESYLNPNYSFLSNK